MATRESRLGSSPRAPHHSGKPRGVAFGAESHFAQPLEDMDARRAEQGQRLKDRAGGELDAGFGGDFHRPVEYAVSAQSGHSVRKDDRPQGSRAQNSHGVVHDAIARRTRPGNVDGASAQSSPTIPGAI